MIETLVLANIRLSASKMAFTNVGVHQLFVIYFALQFDKD